MQYHIQLGSVKLNSCQLMVFTPTTFPKMQGNKDGISVGLRECSSILTHPCIHGFRAGGSYICFCNKKESINVNSTQNKDK